jgi:hypothetical protein
MTTAIVFKRSGRTEFVFNRAVDTWLQEMLRFLGAVPRDVGLAAARSVDGLWWDSSRRLPDDALVLRRNLEDQPGVVPWLVPGSHASPELREGLATHCPGEQEAMVLENGSTEHGLVLKDWVTLQITVEPSLARQEPFASIGATVTQSDFPEILEAIRAQIRSEFGERGDLPD